MKKILILCILLLAFCTALISCNDKTCEHTYDDCADTECNNCGETRDSSHTWVDANCETPKTCEVCNKTTGEALGHTWSDATCTTPQTCKACNATNGEALGHTWIDANCCTPKTCKVCNTTEGEALGHTPNEDDGDCTTPVKCKMCNEIVLKSSNGHTPTEDDRDCSTALTCNACEVVLIEATSHTYSEKWQSDALHHWHACENGTCSVIDTKEEHEPNIYSICDICGHVIEEVTNVILEISTRGKLDYYVGDELDFSNFTFNAILSNGNFIPLSADDVEFDVSNVNMNESGFYTVDVNYEDFESVSIEISVYAIELELSFDAIEERQNSAGEPIYFNRHFKEFYFVGDEFDTSGLTVTVIKTLGNKCIRFTTEDYTVSGFDSSTHETECEITISYKSASTTIYRWVVEPTFIPNEDGIYQLLVDPEYYGIPHMTSGPFHVYQTIQQALQAAARIDADATKQIYLAPGIYNEKLEITVPNIQFIGSCDYATDVVIEFNDIIGNQDASGFTHVLDSTATVAIRETALNVSFEKLTISNTSNSSEGLALLIQTKDLTNKALVEGKVSPECDHEGGTLNNYTSLSHAGHSAICFCCAEEIIQKEHTFDYTTGNCKYCDHEIAIVCVISGDTTTYYNDIDEAVENWTENSTLKLLAYLHIFDKTIVASEKGLVFDTDRYGLYSDTVAIHITEGASLTLKSSRGVGEINGTVAIRADGELIFEDQVALDGTEYELHVNTPFKVYCDLYGFTWTIHMDEYGVFLGEVGEEGEMFDPVPYMSGYSLSSNKGSFEKVN